MSGSMGPRYVSLNVCGERSDILTWLQEQQEEVISKAVAAEPRYGPTWQPIAKDIANVRKSMREILELVADALH